MAKYRQEKVKHRIGRNYMVRNTIREIFLSLSDRPDAKKDILTNLLTSILRTGKRVSGSVMHFIYAWLLHLVKESLPF